MTVKELEPMIPMLGVMIPVLGALLVGIWRFATLAAETKLTLQRLDERLTEYEKDREKIDAVPDVVRRIGQVENTVTAHGSRIAVVESRVTSIRELRALRRPRTGDEGT